jgi:hypothetical protein
MTASALADARTAVTETRSVQSCPSHCDTEIMPLHPRCIFLSKPYGGITSTTRIVVGSTSTTRFCATVLELKVQAAQSGQPDVEDQTASNIRKLALHQFGGRTKHLHPQSHRSKASAPRVERVVAEQLAQLRNQWMVVREGALNSVRPAWNSVSSRTPSRFLGGVVKRYSDATVLTTFRHPGTVVV